MARIWKYFAVGSVKESFQNEHDGGQIKRPPVRLNSPEASWEENGAPQRAPVGCKTDFGAASNAANQGNVSRIAASRSYRGISGTVPGRRT